MLSKKMLDKVLNCLEINNIKELKEIFSNNKIDFKAKYQHFDYDLSHYAALTPLRLETLRLLMEYGCDLTCKDYQSRNFLFLYIQSGKNITLDIIKCAIEEGGVDVNEPDINGNTPLIVISRVSVQGVEEMIKYLLSKGANIKHKGEVGNTVLSWASFTGRYQLVKYLLEYPNVQNFNIEKNEKKTIAYLLQKIEELKKMKDNKKGENKQVSYTHSLSQLQRLVAQMYVFGEGCEENKENVEKGSKILTELSRKGDEAAMIILLEVLENKRMRNKEVETLCLKAAKNGNDTACFYVAMSYRDGVWGEKSIKKAITYFEKACQLKNKNAYYNYGCLYETGATGVKVDMKKALELYLEAGRLGRRDGYLNAGYIYYTFERNLERAAHCYLRAADMGCPTAHNNVGTMYRDGEYFEKDIKKAVDHFAIAAQEEDVRGMMNLGLSMVQYNVDVEKGIEFIIKSEKKGFSFATQQLFQLFNSSVSKQDVAFVTKMKQAGYNFTEESLMGSSSMFHAIKRECMPIVKYLLESGDKLSKNEEKLIHPPKTKVERFYFDFFKKEEDYPLKILWEFSLKPKPKILKHF